MNTIPTSYFVAWMIPSTYFTHAFIIEERVFSTRKERQNYIINRKKKWWEYLPFVTKCYYISPL